jgi:hypothetical protein
MAQIRTRIVAAKNGSIQRAMRRMPTEVGTEGLTNDLTNGR